MDCPSGATSRKSVGSVRPPSRESVFILLSIFLGAIFLAGLLVAIFVDDVKPETDESKKKTKTIKSNLLSTIKIVYKDKRMTFLIPLMIFTGLQPGFVGVDFAKVSAVRISICNIFIPDNSREESTCFVGCCGINTTWPTLNVSQRLTYL